MKKLTCELGGGIGNTCLSIFKTYKFAQLNNIPFDRIVFENKYYCNILRNIKDKFVDFRGFNTNFFELKRDEPDLNKISIPYNEEYCKLMGCGWVYPKTVQDFLLFSNLFDNIEFSSGVLKKYINYFDCPTVGFTVRRGDFLYLPRNRFKVLTDDEINDTIQTIKNLHRGNVRIIITSNDPQYVDSVLTDKESIIIHKPEDPCVDVMVLSFCDYVVNNGAFYRSIDNFDELKRNESTYGQLAQLLGISRKFSFVLK